MKAENYVDREQYNHWMHIIQYDYSDMVLVRYSRVRPALLKGNPWAVKQVTLLISSLI